MLKQKRSKIFITAALILAGLFTSCGSPKPEKLIQNGDYVGAVEQLAINLTKKPTDQTAADLFISIYEPTVNSRIPTESVEEIINEYISGYSSNPINSLKSVADSLSYDSPMTYNDNIMSIINRCSKAIDNLNDLVRMQNAVYAMPLSIGNAKKGSVYSVKKYEQNFAALYNRDVRAFGMFYYYMGEALFPGESIRQRKEILSYYTTATTYVSDISNLKSHGAEVCYQTAEEYFDSDNSLNSINEAINWYTQANSWSNGYKDCQTKIYRCNYDIAMYYKKNAKTISDYENVLAYLNKAGSIRDADEQKKEIAYMLAVTYKEANTASDYEKAGNYFKQLGNYENAANETQLYNFYKKLTGLSKTTSSGSTQLIQGKAENVMTRTLDSSAALYTYLNVTTKAGDIPVYSIVKDGTICPGSMLDGTTIATGKFSSFTSGDRLPYNYTIYAGSSTKWTAIEEGTIEKPNSRAAHNEIAGAAYGKARKITPITTAEYTRLYSDEDLELALGVGYDRNSFTLGKNINWSNTVYLIKISQKYYKASVETPKMPYQFFSTTGNSTVKDSSIKSVTPYYIDDVVYGRVGYFVFSTKMEPADFELTMKDVINREAKSSSLVNSAIRELESEYTTISALSVAEKSWSISTLDKFFSWIKTGAIQDLDIDDLPPISFAIRSLNGNTYGTLVNTGRCKILNPNYVEPVIEKTNVRDRTDVIVDPTKRFTNPKIIEPMNEK